MDGVILWASHLISCSPKFSTMKPLLTMENSFCPTESPLKPKPALSRCGSCKKLIAIDGPRIDGIDTVMEEPDTVDKWCDGKCLDEAHALLEEEEASVEELAEAFAVFDENGDGFIGAEELQIVMGRLLGRGMGMEDCSSMIRAYDENGDGMISFIEFKNMMQFSELSLY